MSAGSGTVAQAPPAEPDGTADGLAAEHAEASRASANRTARKRRKAIADSVSKTAGTRRRA
jgi:hypothetical protein